MTDPPTGVLAGARVGATLEKLRRQLTPQCDGEQLIGVLALLEGRRRNLNVPKSSQTNEEDEESCEKVGENAQRKQQPACDAKTLLLLSFPALRRHGAVSGCPIEFSLRVHLRISTLLDHSMTG